MVIYYPYTIGNYCHGGSTRFSTLALATSRCSNHACLHRGEPLTCLFLVVVDNKFDLGRLQNNHVITAAALLAPVAPPPVPADAAAAAVLALGAAPPVLADAAAAALPAPATLPPVLAEAAAAALLALGTPPSVLAEAAAAALLALAAPPPVRTWHEPIRPRVSSWRRRLCDARALIKAEKRQT